MDNNKEIVIAQSSSTPIEEVQPPIENATVILPEKKLIFNHRKISPIDVIDAKTLLEKDLPPIRFIVEKILPQGLFILAGSPKVGKSWLSLDLCQTVATGSSLWQFQAEKGKVLYLALEDSLTRLQTRLKKYTETGDENLFFAIRALKIHDGLVAQIADFIKDHCDTNLIIIDTMQHVRNNVSNSNAYVNDYNDMNTLRAITEEFDVALILITHTRKLEDADPLNIISGSTGLVGAVDGVMILEKDKRTGTSGKLTITNRDTEGYVFVLNFNKEICKWEFLEEESDTEEKDPLISYIEQLLEEKRYWSGTSTDLSELLLTKYSKKYNPPDLSRKLKSIKDTLKQEHNINCYFKKENNSKIIKISRN